MFVLVVDDLREHLQLVATQEPNAVKFNRPDGRVTFTLAVESDRATIAVGNTGAGLAAEDHSRVFERFYRGDPSRRRDRATGTGLGLSLSREILRAHGVHIGTRRDVVMHVDAHRFERHAGCGIPGSHGCTAGCRGFSPRRGRRMPALPGRAADAWQAGG